MANPPKGTKPTDKPTRPRELTDMQALFVLEYLKDLNATKAAIRAGYSEATAANIGSELLQKTGVADAIGQAMEKRAKRLNLEADRIVRELERLGFSDIRGIFDEQGGILPPSAWPDELAPAIAGVEVFEEFEGKGDNRKFVGYTKKVKLWDKPKSLELLAKHRGMLNPKGPEDGDDRGSDDAPKLSPSEWAAILTKRQAAKEKA